MDIVIPLHEWSGTDNAELKYALRSFEKFMPHDSVVLIGFQPKWITNIIYLPFRDDPQPYYREANIYLKLNYYIGKLNPDEDFIFTNDDHFLLAPFTGEPPYPHKGTLLQSFNSRSADDPYRKTIDNTIKLLGSNKKNNFDVHAPMLMNPKIFKMIFESKDYPVDWTKRYGYLLKSIYAQKFEGERAIDYKINEPLTPNCNMLQLFNDVSFFSTSDKAFDATMIQMLDLLFPEKSKYEL